MTSSALYGGTYNLFAHTFPQYGITVRFADYREPKAWEKLIDAKTKAGTAIPSAARLSIPAIFPGPTTNRNSAA